MDATTDDRALGSSSQSLHQICVLHELAAVPAQRCAPVSHPRRHCNGAEISGQPQPGKTHHRARRRSNPTSRPQVDGLRRARSVCKEVPVTTPGEQPQPRADGAGLVPLGEATRTWFAISLQTFGGPAGQIAVMQHALVDEKRWIGQKRFLHALSFCTLLPGPEAQQLAIYIGWLLNGVRGGLIAGSLFVLPGMLALLGLSALYVGAGDTTIVTAVLPASWSASAPESSTCSRPDRTALHGAVMWPP